MLAVAEQEHGSSQRGYMNDGGRKEEKKKRSRRRPRNLARDLQCLSLADRISFIS